MGPVCTGCCVLSCQMQPSCLDSKSMYTYIQYDPVPLWCSPCLQQPCQVSRSVLCQTTPLPPCSGCLADWCHSGCVGAQIEFPLGFRAMNRSIFGWKQYRLCLKLIFSHIDHTHVVTLMYAFKVCLECYVSMGTPFCLSICYHVWLLDDCVIPCL